MFDKKRGISGELPEHIDFVMNKAKPLFESWGYKVEIVRAGKDYIDLFHHIVERSSKPERNCGAHLDNGETCDCRNTNNDGGEPKDKQKERKNDNDGN